MTQIFLTREHDDDRPPEMVDATIRAIDNLPILARLEFAANLLFDHGGTRDAIPRDWVIVTATEVLQDVISVLRKHPRAAQLRSPEP